MNPTNPHTSQTSSSWQTRYTFSGKEKDEETGYSYFGARYYDSDLSIFLSVDRFTDKYPSLTPYQYAGNNPVIFVDPTGDTIRLADGQSKEFVAAYNQAIEKLKTTERGLELYNNLQNSTQVFIVRENKEGDKNENSFNPSNTVTINNSTGERNETNHGGTIIWNITGGLVPVQTNEKSSVSQLQGGGIYSLFHEMAHAEDQHFGRLTNLDDNHNWNNTGLKESEWSATHTENIIRSQMGDLLRTHYFRTNNKGSGPSLFKFKTKGFESVYKPGYFYKRF
jgi:RHS repeat-associated protein